MKTINLMLSSLIIALVACSPKMPVQTGDHIYDTSGEILNAHGAGILLHDGTYYLFGEHKTEGSAGNRAQVGVHCYSSKDLSSWKDEGIALGVDPEGSGSPIEKGCVLERPKVVYNAKTGKFVMWFHLELKGQGYSAAQSGVAISDSPTGPYKFLHAERPDGEEARDMNIFVDDDGKAYHIYSSEGNKTTHISELTEDYTDHAGKFVRVFEDRYMEAQAMFKRNGKYYMMMSGCTGWAPNAARSAVADNIFGPWTELGNPCVGKGSETSFDTQSTYILQLPGKDRYLYMGDRWQPANAIDGRYVWLPIRWEGDRFFIDSPYPEQQAPMSVAHRGAHVDDLIPENCPAGVAMAARYGFRAIECDVHYTKDSVMILMHDGSINRTMRRASDYSKMEEPIHYRDLTYQELKDNYVLASTDSTLRTPIPTFAEELEACKKYGIIPMLHSDLPEAYKLAHEVLGDNFIAFDSNYDAVKQARNWSSCLILWDPGTTDAYETVRKLDAIGGRCGVSSMNDKLLTSLYIRTIREAGYEVQSSIFPTPKELWAIDRGATIILSDFCLIPVRKGYESQTLAPVDAPVNAEKYDGAEKTDVVLAAGDSLDISLGEAEFGSIELQMEYTGKLDLTVNGERSYPLAEGVDMTRLGGWRFHAVAPSVKIIAEQDSKIKSIIVNAYKY